ncbi:PucR family transcriptional regulator [Brevibacillus invocatus]|uniref:PucR family transcriptional regulator n=1 Tax=Brevibacillus invocatus TaxID=173959 RepID=UPI0005E10238|nr:helix-turn-helix domain-containing protein [Brevibacillus invocatus]MCM3079123.1 helix-turn-helix domain-containing protein [Brevibacillus invocatus]MCM3429334.1 helix-turn-helix domain-containing protein [Brevibacillus invocatus]CFJ17452.1 carbohydrate diacid transcriptional activator CdaR [Mycobacterium tuberculosis]
MDWRNKVEKIAQSTNLPIRYLECSNHEVDQLHMEQEKDGWEICNVTRMDDRTIGVMIQPEHWHPSARSLLELLFTPISNVDPFTGWLVQLLEVPTTPPPRYVREQAWRDRRLCFFLQRCQTESRMDMEWSALQPLLKDFFPGADASLQLVPLQPELCLLLVPLSYLDTDNKLEREIALELAFGLHEMLSCEWMEKFRVLVSLPIEQPASVGVSFLQLHTLSLALQRFCPKIMVAASWQYPLERWASTLSPETFAQVVDGLSAVLPFSPLTHEQRETLETLFARQLNVSEAARQLFLHRNTLLYRLDKITEATGLDPRHFPDAVLLQLHLLFRRN